MARYLLILLSFLSVSGIAVTALRLDPLVARNCGARLANEVEDVEIAGALETLRTLMRAPQITQLHYEAIKSLSEYHSIATTVRAARRLYAEPKLTNHGADRLVWIVGYALSFQVVRYGSADNVEMGTVNDLIEFLVGVLADQNGFGLARISAGHALNSVLIGATSSGRALPIHTKNWIQLLFMEAAPREMPLHSVRSLLAARVFTLESFESLTPHEIEAASEALARVDYESRSAFHWAVDGGLRPGLRFGQYLVSRKLSSDLGRETYGKALEKCRDLWNLFPGFVTTRSETNLLSPARRLPRPTSAGF